MIWVNVRSTFFHKHKLFKHSLLLSRCLAILEIMCLPMYIQIRQTVKSSPCNLLLQRVQFSSHFYQGKLGFKEEKRGPNLQMIFSRKCMKHLAFSRTMKMELHEGSEQSGFLTPIC